MALFDWLIRSPCPICEGFVQTGPGCFCRYCGDQLQKLRFEPGSSKDSSPRIKLYAWGIYKGILQRALHRLKYEQKPQIAASLGSWMGDYWRQVNSGSRYTVVPIPIHTSRLKIRGYNQAELISTAFSRVAELKHQPKLLQRTRETQAQHQLGTRARYLNLKGAFQVVQTTQNPVLLVDDIYTTGSTIAAAQDVLEAAGLSVAGVVVAARAL